MENITLNDYNNLEQMLLSKPDAVLRRFKSCQITDLMQMELFRKILRENPDKAAIIQQIAATFGIECAKPN